MKLATLSSHLLKARSWYCGLALLAIITATGYTFWPDEAPKAHLPIAAGNTLQGRVIEVLDGDTLDLIATNSHTYRVRLSYVDAPERDQPYGPLARQNLEQLLIGKQVLVLVHGQDKYGRLLGEVSRNGQDISEMQLQSGVAWHYLFFAQKQQDARQFARYQQLEETARQQGIGLWQDSQAEAPWDFRRKQHG
ncbi:thermonuclease family protein [Chitinimonas sp. BJB300]|uniref:thermonuclease family protein n=1 Tax=Chitinimonas sp. BJB300 TaxID=1559339 RepID=UPI000C0D97CA|nr:thermonuclease family protein [Chitinimonas sp. BJB300]PHV10264.1 nuclease [Chitinimonas sp. BJB300]TSJ83784.1 nuclease [Chitinimonas sp. BJB300]